MRQSQGQMTSTAPTSCACRKSAAMNRPTRIANAPYFINAVAALRGVIVPIVDLRL